MSQAEDVQTRYLVHLVTRIEAGLDVFGVPLELR